MRYLSLTVVVVHSGPFQYQVAPFIISSQTRQISVVEIWQTAMLPRRLSNFRATEELQIPFMRQGIIVNWTIGTNFNEILIKIQQFSFNAFENVVRKLVTILSWPQYI